MELYTLTSRFLPRESIGEFVSAIWTERYSAAGDLEIVLEPIPSNIEMTTQGTLVGLRGTKEIMKLETQSIENGLLTVKGQSLVKFLDERHSIWWNPDYVLSSESKDKLSREYTETTTAGQFLANVVNNMLINTPVFGGVWAPINLDWPNEKIPGLELGLIDTNGEAKELAFAMGPLYSGIQKLANEEGLGIKLYLDRAGYSTGYVLKFATYRGKNRTSEQTSNLMIRLTPMLDSLFDVKEITSISNYKNVIYVSYDNQVTTHYIPGVGIPSPFDRRVLFVEAPDIFFDIALPGYNDKVAAFREQVARNAIAEHFYIKAVDGQVSTQIDYKFGTDYGLGDIVELEGFTGLISKARVTEYIRTQDQYGEKAYPTLSVIDPLFSGYMPDLEPNPAWESDWNADPDFDMGNDFASDLEHMPRKKRRKRTEPKDPNPDPIPDFTPPVDPPDPGTDIIPAPTDSRYIIVGYYPDQDNGQALAYATFDGKLKKAWHYEPEDNTVEEDSYSWTDLYPLGRTLDNKYVIVMSVDDKEPTEEYDWSRGYAYWLWHPSTGEITKLTDTIPRYLQGEHFNGVHSYDAPGVLWCGSDLNWHLYLPTEYSSPQEFVYANGIYSTDPNLAGTLFYGDRFQTTGGPLELYASWGGDHGSGKATNDELTSILSHDDFPPHMRWSRFQNVQPSPDGTKLFLSRQTMGGSTNWILSSFGAITGGTFTISVGVFGNTLSSFTTAPIPYNATAEYIYNQLLLIPYLQDPRGHGFPYVPYYGGPLELGNQLQFRFDTPVPQGCWMATHTENIISGPLGGKPGTYNKLVEMGPHHWYICNYNGANLEELELDLDIGSYSVPPQWSPDSKTLHWVGPAADGAHYCRWLNYDMETGETSIVLNYEGKPRNVNGYGPLTYFMLYSPNSQKIAYTMRQESNTNLSKLIVGKADGSDQEEIYVDVENPGQDDLVLSLHMAWSYDSKKLAVIDRRNESPIWVFDLVTYTHTKIWPGSGWDNEEEQLWIFDPVNFDGG